MADNVAITPGVGATVAADDIGGGVLVQRVKTTFGADGTATDVSSAAPLPVDTELPAAAALADTLANPTSPMVGAAALAYNGATWYRVREPNVFKSGNAAASFTLWTPAAGKKVRLMRVMVYMTGNVSIAAGAGLLTIDLQEAGVTIGVTFRLFVPQTPVAGAPNWSSGWLDLGSGFVASAINQVINVNLSASIDSTGRVGAVACGTEE